MITEYEVAITLPADIADATYRIDSSMAGSTTDADGNAYTELPGVRLWTASLVADSACSCVEQAYNCSDGNANEWPSVTSLMHAFDTLHAA